jgi:hypothetical protein
MVFIKSIDDWQSSVTFLVSGEPDAVVSKKTVNPGAPQPSASGRCPCNCCVAKNAGYFFVLKDGCELFFEDIKPFFDLYKVPAAREDDLS